MTGPQLTTSTLSPSLFRGCAQIALWPLFSPSKWRLGVRAISPTISPGFAWLDVAWLNFWHDSRLRRVALQTYCIWLIPFVLAFIGQVVYTTNIVRGGYGNTRWANLTIGILAAGFVAVIAMGLSVASATTTSLISSALIAVLCAVKLKEPAFSWSILGILLIVAAGPAIRLKHGFDKPSLRGRLGRIAGAIFLSILVFLTTILIGSLLLAGIAFVYFTVWTFRFRGGLAWLLEIGIQIPFLLMGFDEMFYALLGLSAGALFSLVHALTGAIWHKW